MARWLATGGLILLMLGVAVVANGSSDTWWHLATGRWIVQNHAVPHADPFSFTAAGKPWVAHEYLSDVVMYLVFHLAGWGGLVMLSGTVLTIGWWLVYKRCAAPPVVSGAVVLLGLLSAQPGVSLRPQMFTFLMGAAFLWILDRYQRERRAKLLIALPVLMLLWVQLHGGYILGLAIAGLWLAGAVADQQVTPKRDDILKRKEALPLLCALLASAAVVALNPNWLKAYTHPFTILSMRVNQRITEWKPVDPSRPEFFWFLVLLGLTLLAMIAGWKRYRPGQWLLFLAFAYEALHSGRNIAVFPLVAVPLLAQGIRVPKAVDERAAGFSPKVKALAAIVLLVLGAWWASLNINVGVSRIAGAARLAFPVNAVKAMAAQGLPANLFNSYNFGGYLIWTAPEYKVFVDGRSDVYGDDFVEHYYDVYQGNVPPDPTLNAYGVRTVLVEPNAGIAEALRKEPGTWHVAYEDRVAVVFTR